MIIALASPRPCVTLGDGLAKVLRMIAEAADRRAEIVCFPEAYLPGLRGVDFPVPPYGADDQARVVEAVRSAAGRHRVAVILGLERIVESGRQIAACVFAADGTIQGWQTKNQLDPSEDAHYVPGTVRQMFTMNGVPFGVCICHEGWRYPETVRWAAVRGARIVFHLQHTGCEQQGVQLTHWGREGGPYYEQAMAMRSRENTIYFASVNYALRYAESATSLIDPQGRCQAWLPYGEEGILVEHIDPAAATGLLASRYAPERYSEAVQCH